MAIEFLSGINVPIFNKNNVFVNNINELYTAIDNSSDRTIFVLNNTGTDYRLNKNLIIPEGCLILGLNNPTILTNGFQIKNDLEHEIKINSCSIEITGNSISTIFPTPTSIENCFLRITPNSIPNNYIFSNPYYIKNTCFMGVTPTRNKIFNNEPVFLTGTNFQLEDLPYTNQGSIFAQSTTSTGKSGTIPRGWYKVILSAGGGGTGGSSSSQGGNGGTGGRIETNIFISRDAQYKLMKGFGGKQGGNFFPTVRNFSGGGGGGGGSVLDIPELGILLITTGGGGGRGAGSSTNGIYGRGGGGGGYGCGGKGQLNSGDGGSIGGGNGGAGGGNDLNIGGMGMGYSTGIIGSENLGFGGGISGRGGAREFSTAGNGGNNINTTTGGGGAGGVSTQGGAPSFVWNGSDGADGTAIIYNLI